MNRLSKPAFVAVLALGVWNVSSRTALAAPPRQFVDIQGDVMIWGGSSFALQCSDGQTDPETGILCYSYDHTHNATTTGLQQGWVFRQPTALHSRPSACALSLAGELWVYPRHRARRSMRCGRPVLR